MLGGIAVRNGAPDAGSELQGPSPTAGASATSRCFACCRWPLLLAGRMAGVRDHDTIAHEADAWWALVWPLGLMAAARLSLLVIDQGFVGHLGTPELAGASLAGLWIDVISGWMWPSFGTAVSTLASQAIGAKNEPLAGVWLQTGLVLGSIATIPVMGGLVASESMFTSLGFAARESHLAGTFAAWFAPGIAAGFPFVILLSFLKAQAVVIGPMVISLGMVVVNIFLNILMIHGTTWFEPEGAEPLWRGLGFIGSPIATSLTRWIALGTLAAFVCVSRERSPTSSLARTCTGLQCAKALSGRRMWQMACGFAIPLALSNLLEELQLQVVAFLAAQLGEAQLAAHTSMLTLFFFCSAAMYSAVDATAARIGRHLGAGAVDRGRFVMYLDLLFSLASAVVVASVLGGAGGDLARLFSDDPAVIDAVRPLAVLVGCCYALLCLFFVSVAVLDAMGRAAAVATSFVAGAWLVAVPLAFILDRMAGLGLNGLWYGLATGYAVVTIIAVIFVLRADWNEASRRAISLARNHSTAGPPSSRAAPLAPQFLATAKAPRRSTHDAISGLGSPLLGELPETVGPGAGHAAGPAAEWREPLSYAPPSGHGSITSAGP